MSGEVKPWAWASLALGWAGIFLAAYAYQRRGDELDELEAEATEFGVEFTELERIVRTLSLNAVDLW